MRKCHSGRLLSMYKRMLTIRLFEQEVKYLFRAGNIPGAIHSPPISGPEFIYGAEQIIKLLKTMMKTGKPPVPCHKIMGYTAVTAADQLPRQTGHRVYLKD